jgi:hypothetical protein
MKIRMIMFALAAAAMFFSSTGSAEAAMYVDSEERRTALVGTFALVSCIMVASCLLFAVMARNSAAEEELQPSSEVVPPIKQESNIVQHLITA